MHVSERNIPLVCQDERPNSLTLTVENYIKWYNIYVIFPNNDVKFLDPKLARSYENFSGDLAWSDHLISPLFATWLTESFYFEWDSPSLDMVVGRWVRRNVNLE